MTEFTIITPVKDEYEYFAQTLDSVANQSIKPIKWIIVDDDSTDGTTQLIKEYASRLRFIDHHQLVKFHAEVETVGGRSGVLMNYARQFIDKNSQFVVRMDADISFEKDFFKEMFQKFETNAKLGIISGHLVQDGVPEVISDYSANRGAMRIYARACFEEIGSYYTCRGQDDMDTYTAQWMGWETRTFNVYFNHLKPEIAKSGKIQEHFKTGYYKGQIPYISIYFIAAVARDLLKRPAILGSIAQIFGYMTSRLIHRSRPFKREVCDYIRKNQTIRIKNIFHRWGRE